MVSLDHLVCDLPSAIPDAVVSSACLYTFDPPTYYLQAKSHRRTGHIASCGLNLSLCSSKHPQFLHFT